MTTYTFDDLNKAYEARTGLIQCDCSFALTEMVGGQPADVEGIRQFVKHHLKIEDPVEAEKAVQRITEQEVDDVTPEGGEVPEGKMYGLRALRRTTDHPEFGPYIGDWMVKACLKNAASRLGIFIMRARSKSSFSEGGRVQAWQYSFQNPDQPNYVYMRNPSMDGPAETFHKEFMGRVTTPQGPVSIIHQSECAAQGTRFAWEFRFPVGKGDQRVTTEDVRDILAFAMITGLGSARSLERGKFRIHTANIELGAEEKMTVKPKRTKKNEDMTGALEEEPKKEVAVV